MALADDIGALRERALADLNSAHDYYTHTKIAWNLKAKLGCPKPGEIDRIAEAKASRDVLVHNRGVANISYESKAGNLARYKAGQRIEISEHYHRETWDLIRKVIADVSGAAIAKVRQISVCAGSFARVRFVVIYATMVLRIR